MILRDWYEYLPLVELSYNNSYHLTIYMALYKALNGRICRSQIGWFENGEYSLFGQEFIYKTLTKVYFIRNQLKIV